MNVEKLDMIENLIKNYSGPILISEDTLNRHPNSVVIDANCEDDIIMCHYSKENGEKILPEWFQKLKELSTNRYCLLLVANINEVSPLKQLRFKELLKYGSINGEKLPDNCIMIITHSDLKEKPVIETILSLLAVVD